MQQVMPQQQQQQNAKNQVYIDNLDQGITEDYLFHKFKDVGGKVINLKILREKITQRSKGQAYITFDNQDSAEEARRKFDNSVFIKNTIRVKPFINIQNMDRQANIFISQLPEGTDTKELEQIFSEYGNVQSLEIKQDANGKTFGYGYVQLEKKEDVDRLMERYNKDGILLKGKPLKIEHFKAQTERKTESAAVYFRAITRPLDKETEKLTEKQLQAYQFAWRVQISEFFVARNIEVKDCYAKLDSGSNQPWAMIQFSSADASKDVLNECEQTRGHACLRSSAQATWELVKKNKIPLEADGSPQFDLKEVEPLFTAWSKSPTDPFKGVSENFFFNSMTSKRLNQDERLVLVQNIKEDVTKEELEQFLSLFGKFVRLTIRQSRHPKFKLKQCYVHFQTLEDSKKARSEIYDNILLEEQKKKIFSDNKPIATILMPKLVRKEFRQIKNNSMIYQNVNQRKMILPTWQQPMFAPQNMHPQMRMPPQMAPQNRGHPQQFMGEPRPMRQHQQFPGSQRMGQGYGGPRQGGQQQQRMGGGPMGMRQMPPQGPPFAQQGAFNPPQGQFPPGQPQFGPNQFVGQIPFGMPQGIRPQGMAPPVAQPAPQRPQFTDYQQIKANMNTFSALAAKDQRNILGQLLVREINRELPQAFKGHANKITGMLMDEEQFEIEDVIGFFEDRNELNERIKEAIELITETDQS